jgi:transcriptional regulator with XRE-family HTH domain
MVYSLYRRWVHMAGGFTGCADKIKALREQLGLTQAELAKRLGLTRASVNGWEMGLAVPSTAVLVELAQTFRVSTDYLLGLPHDATINVNGLSEKEVAILADLINCFHNARQACSA